MVLNSVSGGNALRWESQRVPFHEVYYFKTANASEGWSFWARYTLLVPRNAGQEAQAALWGIFFRRTPDHVMRLVPDCVAIKQTRRLQDLDPLHAERFIDLGSGHLSLDGARGLLEDSDHKLTWDLKFEDPNLSLALYRPSLLYSLPFPKTKFVEPRLSTHVSGTVTVDRTVYKVEHAKAHQAHLWGTEYAQRWAWGNCNDFIEDPTAVFEGLSAQIKLGPLTSPWVTLFYFVIDGQEFCANGISRWFKNKSRHDLLEWEFEVLTSGKKITGSIRRPLPDTVGVEYLGPKGEKRYCHSSMLSSIELTIYRREKKYWMLEKTLTSPACAFETVEPKQDHRVHFVL